MNEKKRKGVPIYKNKPYNYNYTEVPRCLTIIIRKLLLYNGLSLDL